MAAYTKQNVIKKSDLIRMGTIIMKGFRILQEGFKYRRRYNLALTDDQRVYVRVMYYKFSKWSKSSFPVDYNCMNRERKATLISAEEFFKQIIKGE